VRSPTIGELPPPPAGKTGWPWTEGRPQVADTMPDGRPWPRISIVTPSFNQGRFIEATIRSVLLQGYPDLEYVVMDGGSTDGTVETIKRYEPYLSYWVSRPDRGQTDAICQGLEKVSGAWFNWLNADDILLPGALTTLADVARTAGDAEWITGGRLLMSEAGAFVDVDVPWRSDASIIGLDKPSFPQDATFIRPDLMRRHGIRPREGLNVFDTVLHFELFRVARPVVTTAVFSAMRLHPQQKTADEERRARENRTVIDPILRRYPLWARAVMRLLRTRYGVVVAAALRCAVHYGISPPARKWRAVAFVYGDFAWRVQPARRLVQ
jgi:glycosyltransferase involved in cell wall biosynthesis